MKALQRLVVLVLLGVWAFPAVSQAKPNPAPAPAAETSAPARRAPADSAAPASPAESAALAKREQQSKQAQDFRGGQEGVSIYIGSGVLLVAVIVLLLVLLV
jgi:hypothetical protein